jgi:hypothetical protein
MAQTSIRGGTVVAEFDLKPDWRGILPALTIGLTNGSPEAQRASELELQRMAGALDDLNERVGNCRRYSDALNSKELAPNGDDFNRLFDLLGGAAYADPKPEGR